MKTTETIIIDWIDIVQVQGKKYEGDYYAVLGDKTKLGQQLGEVKLNMEESVHDPSYKMKNGDAAFLEVGADIFAVQGRPDLVAVEKSDWPNGYKLYAVMDDPNYIPQPHAETVKIAAQDVQKIGIYSNGSPLTELSGPEVKTFLEAITQGSNPLAEQVGDGHYSVVLYTGETLVTDFKVDQLHGQADWTPNLDLDGHVQY